MLLLLAVFAVASTMVALLGVPSWLLGGRRRMEAGCGIAGFAAGWRIAAEKCLGYCRCWWVTLGGDH